MQKVTTPIGKLAWVSITGEGKENLSGTLQYKADLLLEPAGVSKEHDAFVASIEKYWEDNKPANFKKKAKSTGVYLNDPMLDENNKPVKNEDDETVYDPKGRRALRFKTATTWPDGKQKVIKTFNSKAKPVDLGDTTIGNGSVGIVSGIMDIYGPTKTKEAGVSLYLDKIMILKLVENEGENPFAAVDGYDFEDTDESFSGESPAEESTGRPRI